MPWANIDDRFPSHPKIGGLTDGAFRLHVSGICYSSQYLTDGLIPATAVPSLMLRYKSRFLDELVQRGLWYQQNGSYQIHDYLQWNKSKAEIREKREHIRQVRSEAGKKGAASKWEGKQT